MPVKAIIIGPSEAQVNTEVTLDGSQSTGDIKKINFIQKKGPKVKITKLNPQGSIIKFKPTKVGDVQFKLKVDSTTGEISRAWITITISNTPTPCGPNSHRDPSGKCVCDTGFHDDGAGNCVPDHECPPGQHWDGTQCVPDPVGDVLYDSNTDINWAGITGEFLKVTDIYGTFKPNAKYFRMKASGKPRMYLYKATKEFVLEHDGKYGRAYFGVCNYASRLEIEFKLDNCGHNISLKTRNRHQYSDVKPGAPDKQRQGGQGCSVACGSTDADLEVVHGTEVSGPSASISPKLVANKWYKLKFSQFDKNGKIHIVAELDRGDGQGFKKINEGDTKAPSQFFNKAEFETWSEFWLRLNATDGGKLWMKNIKLYAL